MLDVLIVDDSLIFRKTVAEALNQIENINIVGSVRNGEKAIEFLEKETADFVSLDVEMPDMNGLETLKKIQIMKKDPNSIILPNMAVLMLSSFTTSGANITMESLEAGAFDFITKPGEGNKTKEENFAILKESLRVKISAFSNRKNRLATDYLRKSSTKIAAKEPIQLESKLSSKYKIILIGSSTGGPKALMQLLPELCHFTDLPIAVVQHMPKGFTKSLAENIDKKCDHKVLEVTEDTLVEKNKVYIAPGGLHMVFRKSNQKGILLGLNEQDPENGCRPSVDVMFRSASQFYKDSMIACILTGMGNDGSKSLRNLKSNGAFIFAQDEKSSVVWGMPGSAFETGFVDKVSPLSDISNEIHKLI